MKTHLIDKLLAPILVVELPEGSINEYSVFIRADNETSLVFKHSVNNDICVRKFKENWQIVGKLTELQDEDVFDLVHSAKQGKIAIARSFKNYKNEKGCFVSALHSFLSAIESEIYWENPYPNPVPIKDEQLGKIWNDKISKYVEAESRTFDKSRTIILKKV